MSEAGDIIEGRYEVLFKLSEGGMGQVFKVRHLLLDEVFVAKRIRAQRSDDEKLEQRFLREARTAIRLKHPNLAGIHDFFISKDGTAYLVMEFIDGMTLKDILESSGPPSLEMALEMARQTLEALSFLHTQGYLHRDISPDNLMLTRNFDGRPWMKVLDLGLATSLEGKSQMTSFGMFLGKARYSPPERINGTGKLDETSDLYSFGVTFYELLTGEYPIEGKDFGALIAGHLLKPPRPFEETDPHGRVPPALREIILQTLEKTVEKRIGSAKEILQRLAAVETGRWTRQETESIFLLPSEKNALAEPEPTVELQLTDDESAVLAAMETGMARVAGHLDNGELEQADAVLTELEEEYGLDQGLKVLRRRLEELQRPA